MNRLRITDETGDTEHWFDPDNATQVADAKKVFDDFLSRRFAAAEKLPEGSPTTHKKITEFNPAAAETAFIRPLQGG